MTLTMTPEHQRWDEFIDRLEGPEGCNFREDEFSGTLRWECKAGTDKSKARAILESMGDIDIDASFLFFEQHGGYCDCEILFNVVDTLEEALNAITN